MQSAAAEPASIDDAGTITVTASRIADLAAATADRCQRGGCRTREDVAVSVSYASALFDRGEYLDAKRLLAAAVARNRAAGQAEPLAVSQLYTAQATLAKHEGDQKIVRDATWASRNLLATSPGVPVLQRLTAEFRLGDWQLRTGKFSGAEARFATVATEARAAGEDGLADIAELRRALTLAAMRRRADSFALLETLAARTGPGADPVRRAALATASRLAFVRGDLKAADGYMARLTAIAAGPEPLLVSEPPLPKPRSRDIVALRWVDISFWIRPDGRVDDAAILRGSATTDWAQVLIDYINGRRYSGFAAGAGGDQAKDHVGRYHVERYTLTADYGVGVGSLIRRRGVNPRFEMLEMSGAQP
jgi:hypothetical protein